MKKGSFMLVLICLCWWVSCCTAGNGGVTEESMLAYQNLIKVDVEINGIKESAQILVDGLAQLTSGISELTLSQNVPLETKNRMAELIVALNVSIDKILLFVEESKSPINYVLVETEKIIFKRLKVWLIAASVFLVVLLVVLVSIMFYLFWRLKCLKEELLAKTEIYTETILEMKRMSYNTMPAG